MCMCDMRNICDVYDACNVCDLCDPYVFELMRLYVCPHLYVHV